MHGTPPGLCAQQARTCSWTSASKRTGSKVMISDRGPDFTAAFDAVLADSGIRIVLCNVRTPRMNPIAGRWIGDAGANFWTAPSSETRPICGGSCASTRSTTISTGLTAPWTQLRR
jgi:hypothetical protein